MVSCTEFIPAYSMLFAYIDKKSGRAAVHQYFRERFTPSDNPTRGIYRKLLDAGCTVRGCWDYWSHSLNEEAADFTFMLNEEEGYFANVMHHCPSKGRLLDLQAERGFEPFEDYCLHCDGYRLSCEKAGLNYLYDFTGTDKAQCALIVTDPKIFRGDVQELLKEIRTPGWGKDCPNQY